jgi:hypothetical protein
LRVLAAIVSVALSGAAAGVARGYEPKVNFELHCMGCHLADGSGEPGRVPSMRRSLALFSTTREGRDYVIRVPGVAQSPLSNEDTAALLNWMIENLSDLAVSPRGAPPRFVRYSPAEIQRSREHPLSQVEAARARLIEKMPDGRRVRP